MAQFLLAFCTFLMALISNSFSNPINKGAGVSGDYAQPRVKKQIEGWHGNSKLNQWDDQFQGNTYKEVYAAAREAGTKAVRNYQAASATVVDTPTSKEVFAALAAQEAAKLADLAAKAASVAASAAQAASEVGDYNLPTLASESAASSLPLAAANAPVQVDSSKETRDSSEGNPAPAGSFDPKTGLKYNKFGKLIHAGCYRPTYGGKHCYSHCYVYREVGNGNRIEQRECERVEGGFNTGLCCVDEEKFLLHSQEACVIYCMNAGLALRDSSGEIVENSKYRLDLIKL